MSRERLVKAVAETEDRLKKLRDGEIPKAAASTSSTAAATDAVAPPASPVSSPPLTPDQSPNSTFFCFVLPADDAKSTTQERRPGHRVRGPEDPTGERRLPDDRR